MCGPGRCAEWRGEGQALKSVTGKKKVKKKKKDAGGDGQGAGGEKVPSRAFAPWLQGEGRRGEV